MSTKYIAYYRVSTQKQGISGLGLGAQQESVSQFVTPDQLVGQYTEVESGKRDKNRPMLAAAMADAKKRKATLIIAKLDRLARNVHFVSGLMESKVDFLAVDMPYANKLTIHILAAVAEHEAQMISARTKAALQFVKSDLEKNGPRVSKANREYTKLGNPRLDEARMAAAKANRGHVAPEVVSLMKDARANGATLRAIADKLNKLGLRTTRGNEWHSRTVLRELDRVSS